MIRPLLRAACLGLSGIAALTQVAAAQPEPLMGTFTEVSREVASSPEFAKLAFDSEIGCLAAEDSSEPLYSRGGTFSDNDASHYARGSVLTMLVFVDHDGGTWDNSERQVQAAKSHDAKQFFLEHMPEEGYLEFIFQESNGFAYYNATLPYDIADYGNFENWMITDAAADIGFSDDDGDGSIIDDMTIELQTYLGGYDNVITVFIPADYDFSPAQAGTQTSWTKVSYDMHWAVWAHEWGHAFGACDEGGGPAGCNEILCDDICMSYYLVDQVPNGNCVYCTDGQECLMRSAWVGSAPCDYTYRNWGWDDDDGDGKLDDTVAWDPYAEDIYQISELFHNGWYIHSDDSRGWAANQKWESWGVMGVRSRDASEWNIQVHGDNNRNHFLAQSFIGSGVKFVVGDFNHTNRGQDNIRLVNTGGAGQYMLSYEAGDEMLFADGVDRMQSWDDLNVVRAYDLPLFGGETIQIQLDVDTAGLDLGMALFKSNGSYYAPRSQSFWEVDDWPAGFNETHTFVVPEDDVYGLIVWSETEVDGTFSIQIGPSVQPLTEAVPFSSALDLRLYRINPTQPYWAVAAVRPGEASDVSLSLFEESTFQMHRSTSDDFPGVEFVAVDYSYSQTLDFLRVVRESGVQLHTTEWEQGTDILAGWDSDIWEGGHVCKAWDVYLEEGETYRFQYYGAFAGPVDAKIYLASSENGYRFRNRDWTQAESAGDAYSSWFEYTAPENNWYGVIMIAEDEAEASYSLGVGPSVDLVEEVPVTYPDELIFSEMSTANGSWSVVGVRPETGSESSIWMWECEDENLSCFRGGDVAGEPIAYVVMDANHEPAQTYYSRVDRSNGIGAQTVSFDIADSDDIEFDPAGMVVARGEFVEGEVAHVWDLNVANGPVAPRVTVMPLANDLDVTTAIFNSGNGEYIQGSSDRVAVSEELGPGESENLVFVATSPDVYGLVVSNVTGAAGRYEIYVYNNTATEVEESEQLRSLDLRALATTSGAPSFELSMPEAGRVRLEVFDIVGRHVQTLADVSLDSGTHVLNWDGRRGNGESAGSGVYFVKLRALDQERTVKVVRTH